MTSARRVLRVVPLDHVYTYQPHFPGRVFQIQVAVDDVRLQSSGRCAFVLLPSPSAPGTAALIPTGAHLHVYPRCLSNRDSLGQNSWIQDFPEKRIFGVARFHPTQRQILSPVKRTRTASWWCDRSQTSRQLPEPVDSTERSFHSISTNGTFFPRVPEQLRARPTGRTTTQRVIHRTRVYEGRPTT